MHSLKLDIVIEALLTEQFKVFQELDFIKQLQAEPYCLFMKADFSQTSDLFAVHFAVYNTLYRLRDKWLAEQKAVIEIELSRFSIKPYSSLSIQQIVATDALRDYYLNWQNFTDTTADDLTQMLDAFWQKMAVHLVAPADKTKAYKILAVAEHANISTIKKAYKKQAIVHHPDKGGDAELFQQVTWAWQILSLK